MPERTSLTSCIQDLQPPRVPAFGSRPPGAQTIHCSLWRERFFAIIELGRAPLQRRTSADRRHDRHGLMRRLYRTAEGLPGTSPEQLLLQPLR